MVSRGAKAVTLPYNYALIESMISPVLLPLVFLISVPPLTSPNFVNGLETDEGGNDGYGF